MMENKESKTRLSNLELLRIISMIMIVSSHYVIHAPKFVDGLTINKYILDFISLGGKIGVNCFILITGYFLVKSRFKFEKLIKIVIEVFTYSVIMFIITLLFTDRSIGIKELLKTFLPIIYSNYWFVTNYIGLYIISPFINKLIEALNENEYKNLLIVSFVILSVIPTVTAANFVYSNLIWFIFLYLIAGYIRLYYNSKIKNEHYLYIAISVYILIFILAEIIFIISQYIPQWKNNVSFFGEINKVTAVICSISLFMYFKNLNIKYNKYINIVAASTFAIYLIHDNYLFKEYFWENVTRNEDFYGSPIMILHYIVTIILIFIFGTIVEYFRTKIMEKPVNYLIKRVKFLRSKNDIKITS